MSKHFGKAGAIIIRENDGILETLLEYRGRHDLRDWSFPKGGIEAGETPEGTAKREIMEETGLEVAIIKPLPDIFYHNTHDGEVKVYMFLARPSGGELKPEYKGDKVEWVPLDRVLDILSYQNLKDYFTKVSDELTFEKIT